MRNFIICVFAFIMWGCANKIYDGYLCRFLYFQTRDNANCFWVEVKEDRTMKVTFGDMTWDCQHAISSGKFPDEGITWEVIKKEDSIKIDLKAYKQLEVLSSDVIKKKSVNKFRISISWDGMGVVLFIKDHYYYVELGDYKDKALKDFIKKLRELSPIPIRGSVGSVLQEHF